MSDVIYYTLEQHLESFKGISQDHDESHSRKVIKNIEMLLGRERIKQLSPTDTWLILMSAYLHDAGMILVSEVLNKDWSSDEFQEFLKKTSEGCYNNYDETLNWTSGFSSWYRIC